MAAFEDWQVEIEGLAPSDDLAQAFFAAAGGGDAVQVSGRVAVVGSSEDTVAGTWSFSLRGMGALELVGKPGV